MSLRGAVLWRRHLRRTAFGAVQVSNPIVKSEIASGEEKIRPRNDMKVYKK